MSTKKKAGLRTRKTKAAQLEFKPRLARADKYALVIEELRGNLKRPGDAVTVSVPLDSTASRFRNSLSALISRRLPDLASKTKLRVLAGEKEVAVIRK